MKTLVLTLITAVFIISTTYGQAKEIQVSGTFTPKDRSAAYVTVLGNTNQKLLLAQAKVTDGIFSLKLPADLPLGVYKLGFASQDKFNFYLIHDGEYSYHIDFKNVNNSWTFTSNTGNEHRYITRYWKQRDSLMESIRIFYYFAKNYPHKEERIYKKNSTVLNDKVKDFKRFRTQAITQAPLYSNELLTHNKIVFHEPQLDVQTIEKNYLNTLWENLPKLDTTFYNKPYVTDKLQASFDGLLKDRSIKEKEKYQAVKERLIWLLEKLDNQPDKLKYYNLCLRYFASKNYPYVFNTIDNYLDQKHLFTTQDSEDFIYRAKQQHLIQKKAPSIATALDASIFDAVKAERKVLVFVADNTPFSHQLLNGLKEQIATKVHTKVIAVLLTDHTESIQNFINLYPNWTLCTLKNEVINNVVQAYKLFYAPAVFVLDKDNTILELKEPFATL